MIFVGTPSFEFVVLAFKKENLFLKKKKTKNIICLGIKTWGYSLAKCKGRKEDSDKLLCTCKSVFKIGINREERIWDVNQKEQGVIKQWCRN